VKTLPEHLRDTERDYLIVLLAQCKGNVTKASEVAGIHRSTLYDLLGKHDLTRENMPPVHTVRRSWRRRFVDLHS